MAKASDIVVFDNLNVKGIQAFYGPMVNNNLMGMVTNITQYQVTHYVAAFTVFVNTNISLI
jgi:putative transposase